MGDSGKKVALIEGNKVGGTCVNFGCTPGKTLIGSARALHAARRGDEFGFHTAEVEVDFARVMQRQREIVDAMRGRGERRIEDNDNITLYRAWAQFEAPPRLRVGDELFESEHIYLNIDGRAEIPDLPGLKDIPYLDNVTLLELNTLPRHLIILGGGYIAMEHGQAFRRFGSEVTIVQRDKQVLNREDPDAEEAVLKATSSAIHQFSVQHPDQMQRLVDHLLARKQERDQRRFGQ